MNFYFDPKYSWYDEPLMGLVLKELPGGHSVWFPRVQFGGASAWDEPPVRALIQKPLRLGQGPCISVGFRVC